MRNRLSSILAVLLLTGNVVADDAPGLGMPLSAQDQADLPAVIMADGSGLPDGEGNALLGEQVFQDKCMICHGPRGMGGSALELVGDRALLATAYPDKGIAVYWPYGPPLFDYIRRSMPPSVPYSLSNEEVYAVIAYLLELSDLLESGAYLDADRLSMIRMPNRDNFTEVYQPVK